VVEKLAEQAKERVVPGVGRKVATPYGRSSRRRKEKHLPEKEDELEEGRFLRYWKLHLSSG